MELPPPFIKSIHLAGAGFCCLANDTWFLERAVRKKTAGKTSTREREREYSRPARYLRSDLARDRRDRGEGQERERAQDERTVRLRPNQSRMAGLA